MWLGTLLLSELSGIATGNSQSPEATVPTGCKSPMHSNSSLPRKWNEAEAFLNFNRNGRGAELPVKPEMYSGGSVQAPSKGSKDECLTGHQLQTCTPGTGGPCKLGSCSVHASQTG